MAVLSSLVVRLATNTAAFTSGLAKSTKDLQKFAKTARNIQRRLSQGVVTGAGIIAADSIRNAAEFGDKLQDLQAITGATGDSLRSLRDQALDFGASTTRGAEEALTAFKLVGSAKPELLANSEALGAVTRQVVLLSEAARLDLPTAVNATAVSLNQFGESAAQAARFVNVLAAGSKFGASEVRDTALAIRESGTVAAQAGISFEELNGLIQALAEGGIKGSRAGTALRTALVNLESQGLAKIKPSTDGVVQAFQNLAAEQLSTAERAKLFGKESLAAANILIDSAGKIDDYTKAVTGTRTANEQAAAQANSLVGDLQKLSASYDALSTQIGQKFQPTQRGVVRTLTDVIRAIDLVIAPTDNAVKSFGVFDFVLNGITKTIIGVVSTIRMLANDVASLGGSSQRSLQKLFAFLDLTLSKEQRAIVLESITAEGDRAQKTLSELNEQVLQTVRNVNDGLDFGFGNVDGFEEYQQRLKDLVALSETVKPPDLTPVISSGGGLADNVKDQLERAFEQIRTSSLSREQFIFESLEKDKAKIAEVIAAIPSLAAEGNRVIAALELQAGQKLNKLAESTKDNTTKISQFATQAARNMQSVFAQFLFDPFEQGIKGMLRGFIDVLRRMVAEAAAAKILNSLGFGLSGVSPASGGAGGLSGFLSSGLGALIGSGGSSGGIAKVATSSFSGSSSKVSQAPAVLIQQTNDFRSSDPALIERMPAILEQNKQSTITEVSSLLSRGLLPTG